MRPRPSDRELSPAATGYAHSSCERWRSTWLPTLRCDFFAIEVETFAPQIRAPDVDGVADAILGQLELRRHHSLLRSDDGPEHGNDRRATLQLAKVSAWSTSFFSSAVPSPAISP